MSAVTWTGLVNATAVTGGVRKTGGCDGCPDAGAVSQQRMTTGTGFVELKGVSGFYFVGLDTATVTRPGPQLAYALRLREGTAEVREGGIYRSETKFTSTDVLRITATASSITYSKNGVTFWTSAVATPAALGVSTSIYDMNLMVAAPLIMTQ
jgi:hypothetical protein